MPKLKRRPGRKGNPNAKRRQTTRAGQGRDQIILAETLQQRALASGLPVAAAHQCRAGFELGRMRLHDQISEAEFYAGVKFAGLWRAYHNAIDAPSATPRSADMGFSTAPMDCADVLDETCMIEDPDLRRARIVMTARHAATAMGTSSAAVIAVAVRDIALAGGQARKAQEGLGALVRLWGLQHVG